MRKMNRYLLLVALLALTACQQRQPRHHNIVEETYVHKYGIEVQQKDWASRGKHGQVISTQTDGVVVTRTYDGGVLNGETSYTFPHSTTIARVETYDHGTLVKVVDFYKCGVPQQQTSFPDEHTRKVATWFQSGVPENNETYIADNLIEGEYYNEGNELESRVDDGYGSRILRNVYGEPETTEEVENGKVVAALSYHPDGTPKSIIPYYNGRIEGELKTFNPGGEPATVEQWQNGLQHGITTVYENGRKAAEVPYVNGKKTGLERRFSDDGILVEEISWLNDMRHGVSRTHVGNTTKTQWYFHDKPVKKGNYDLLSNPNSR
ncbi:MAG: toxin-antitoxin system YwqK family antitoxin [Chlamydiales bacterium]|nr:toxin-antitoxin system YwqK family antitoxin [Chlamydiia bacterium]MCP5506947.1 toxin-antitoxin system YwqK family antitoxin [Chlamydiales bacterium]